MFLSSLRLLRAELRVSEDELRLILEFCDGDSLTSLACTCVELRDAVYREEEVWKCLYNSFHFSHKPQAPIFPNAGSWREAMLRAKAGSVSVLIRAIGQHDKIKVQVNRSTTLFGLKKMVRQIQLRRYGIALEDFELVDLRTLAPLGVQGYDSLPPSDLSILFVSSDTMLRSARINEAFRRLLNRNQRPAWRKDLKYIPDGIELCQVFVGVSGTLQFEHRQEQLMQPAAVSRQVDTETGNVHGEGTEDAARQREMVRMECPDTLREFGDGFLEVQTNCILDPACTDEEKKWCSFRNLCMMIAEGNRGVQYLCYKPYWKKEYHPLVHILLSGRDRKVPVFMRLQALLELLRQYALHLVSKDFVLNSLTRAFLGTGFLAVFIRLVVKIIPLILRMQIKQVMEGEIDWIPLIFATKFLVRIALLVGRSAYPVAVFAFAHQALRAFLRSVVCEETERDDMLIYLVLLVLSRTVVPKAKARIAAAANRRAPSEKAQETARNLRQVLMKLFNLDDASSYAYLTKRVSDRVWALLERHAPWLTRSLWTSLVFLRRHPLMQYILSGLVWELAERRMSHALLVSVPVYAYSVPFLLSVMLIRLRIALSDSYYYMLYI